MKIHWKYTCFGRTGCGKITFAQNLGKNSMLGNIKGVLWVTKIMVSKDSEHQIRSYFNVPVEIFTHKIFVNLTL